MGRNPWLRITVYPESGAFNMRKLFFLTVVLWALLASTQTQTVALPDTAPARLLSGWLQAFNSADAAKMQQFASDHFTVRPDMTPEARAKRDKEFREMTGGFDLVKIEDSTPSSIVAIMKERGGMGGYARLELSIEEQTPDRIAQIKLNQSPPPDEAKPAKMTVEQLSAEVDPMLTKESVSDEFSGVVLIAKDGKPIWQKAYGLANRETKKPNTMDTTFNLGSMNKMFTSVAIAQLVQAGKLKYTDTLAHALPDYPNKDAAQKITISQLLSHTSGLGDIFGPEFDQKKDSLREVKDYLPLFANKPLEFEPGQGHSYSNAGFVMLGLIIEKISGENYYDYIQKHVYDVAGMKHAGSPPKTKPGANQAVSYTRHNPEHKLEDATPAQPFRGFPAGGGQATAADMLAFDQAFRNHRLLNAELTEAIITPHSEQSPEFAYGYGMGIRKVGGHRIVGHNGGAPGVNGEIDMYLDSGYTVVVLANCDPPAAGRVIEYIRQRMP